MAADFRTDAAEMLGGDLIQQAYPGVKDAVDNLLAKGASDREILARVRRRTRKAAGGAILALAVEAYLRARRHG